MSKSVMFKLPLSTTQDEAAIEINISPRQFKRQIAGHTKEGITPITTLADLKRKEIIDEEAVQAWWKNARETLRFKREKPRRLERSLRKLVKQIIAR